jgi:hypothetical protein
MWRKKFILIFGFAKHSAKGVNEGNNFCDFPNSGMQKYFLRIA